MSAVDTLVLINEEGARVTVLAQRTPMGSDLEQACALVGLDPRAARHLRSHANELWLLPRAGVVVRLSLEPSTGHVAAQTIRLVRWLVEQDLPVASPWSGEPGPLTLSTGRVATYWRALDVPESTDYRAFGRLLRQLHHASPPPEQLGIPALDPLALAAEILDGEWPDCGVDRGFVAERLSDLEDRIRSARWPLPPALLHGDAHVGNLLVDRGRLVLGDWDSACVGTPGWDLLPTALEPPRWGRPEAVYRAFVEGYGQDVTTWPHYRELRELLEWRRIAERIRIAARVPHAGRNLRRHLRTMHAGDVDTPWYGPEAETSALPG